ncbi:MAG: chloride channel protein [Clostridia bacterium]|nr:chloride channel protein [Clostridia bacterium]
MKVTDFKNTKKYTFVFIKWIIIALVVGAVGGAVGSLFHLCVDFVTEVRVKNDFIIYFLPIAGLVVAGMYKLTKSCDGVDTNCVIEAVQTEREVPFKMAPLIFGSTVITHLFGGSAGREGAALQLGGSIGYNIGKIFRLTKRELHLIVMLGMSAVFTALFGTPVTAVFFSMEVINVGIVHYTALIPAFVAVVTAKLIASGFGISPVAFNISSFPGFSFDLLWKTVVIAFFCALVGILFCFTLEKTEHLVKKLMPNIFVRGFAGGALIVLLTVLVGNNDYNGAGMDIIENAISGQTVPWAFILKIIFTAITVACGFKGGEIVPAFFIGSTFGCTIAPLLGLDASFGAVLGFVCLFCSAVNCPVASLMLALEVFGSKGILIFAVAVAVSYVASGNFSLYKSQKISYSKIENKFLNE